MISLYLAFFMTIIAGILNGSYPGPLQKLSAYNQDLVWAYFSIFAFVMLPILSTSLLFPGWLQFISLLPARFFLVSITGGVLFGIGMVFFTIALRFIGIGIAFLLNISFGTLFGSLVPVFILAPQKLFTLFGLVDFIALLLFLVSVTCSSRAAALREKSATNPLRPQTQTARWLLGLVMGIASGLFCAAQGAAFGLCVPIVQATAQQVHILQDPLMVIWVVIFGSAFVPYFLFYVGRGRVTLKGLWFAETLQIYRKTHVLVLMGILYYSTLVIYSFAVNTMGHYGNVIGWPLLMSAIIITSNFWSWRRGEWNQAPERAVGLMRLSIGVMVLAVVFLGVGAHINQ